jgi:NADH-quinone oxidoreductase subunit K
MRLWESILWYNSDLSLLGVTSVDYLIFFFLPIISSLLLFISILGLFYKNLSLIHILLLFEIIVLGINLLVLSFALFFSNIEGYIIFLILLTVAAAESSIGLSLIILLYRYKEVTSLTYLVNLTK